MNSNEAVNAYARGIFNAFMAYRGKLNNIIMVPYKPETTPEPEIVEKPKTQETTEKPVSESKIIIYKVQILATDGVLRKNDYRLKGRTDAEYYKENGMVKYTLGSFDTMSEANNYRRELNNIFPGCFVVKFQDGKRVQ